MTKGASCRQSKAVISLYHCFTCEKEKEKKKKRKEKRKTNIGARAAVQ
jgi:hypothetical protein